MEDYRSRSYADGRMEIEVYEARGPPPPPSGPHDFRSYSASYTQSGVGGYGKAGKKDKGVGGASSSGKGSSGWSLSDPELQRRKRVAGYKAYTVEGKMKGSFRKSFRWLKDKYSQVVYGWW